MLENEYLTHSLTFVPDSRDLLGTQERENERKNERKNRARKGRKECVRVGINKELHFHWIRRSPYSRHSTLFDLTASLML